MSDESNNINFNTNRKKEKRSSIVNHSMFWPIVLSLFVVAILVLATWLVVANSGGGNNSNPGDVTISGLYFDYARNSVMQITPDASDKTKFLVNNMTFAETGTGTLLKDDKVRIKFADDSIAIGTLRLDSQGRVCSIGWGPLASHQWFLATRSTTFSNKNQYCQLIKHPDDINSVVESYCGWCAKQDETAQALYYDETVRTNGSADGTCMVTEGFVVPEEPGPI